MTHSLDKAVADGTITEQAAFCGISKEDLEKLVRAKYWNDTVLVRFRHAHGDGRKVMTINELWSMSHLSRSVHIDDTNFGYYDIRDISAVPQR